MNLLQQIKSFRTVPKRNAFKAQDNISVSFTNWVDAVYVRGDFSYLFNRILQAVFTQPENESPSFLTCRSIISNKSSSKRIILDVLLERSKLLFLFFSCIGLYHCGKLLINGLYHVNCKSLKKQSLKVLPALLRDLTQPLDEVMIMANRYDTAQLCARQSKLYKFYDLSTARVVQSIAPTERQARKNLGKQSLVFIARIHLYPVIEGANNRGGYSYE